MPHARRETLLSTVILGLYQDPNKLARIVRGSGVPFKYAEVIGTGLPMTIGYMINGLDEHGIMTRQIHSRTGVSPHATLRNKVRERLFQFVMPSLENIAKHFPKQDLVIHTPLASGMLEDQIKRLRPMRTFIEVHDMGQEGILATTREVMRFRKLGVLASGIIDWAHVIGSRNLNGRIFRKRWSALVDDVGRLTAQPYGIFRGIHAPVGTYVWDSVPDKKIDRPMREDMAQATGPSIRRVTIEYLHHKPLNLLFLRSSDEKAVSRRLGRVVEKWVHAGLLQF